MDGEKIINDYAEWIRNNSFVRKVEDGEYFAITTPFLDHHNDNIDIYISSSENGGYLLSDGGDTIADLTMAGSFPNTPKRERILTTILNGFGVMTDNESIFVEAANSGELPRKKHNLIQAILAVDDMYVMSYQSIHSLFKEDVMKFFSARDIPFVSDVRIAGKSGYDHNVDFVLPKNDAHVERLVKVFNRINKNQVQVAVFAFSDIVAIRPTKNEPVVFYNDELGALSKDAGRALAEYGIKYVPWSERNKILAI